MPGGAPIKARKKRPCKYGPRDADGLCPKAPKKARAAKAGSTTRAASSGKRPCKYGPRDADGRCPKKPSTAGSRTRVTAQTAKGATKQAAEVLANRRATSEQKVQAVTQAATTVGVDVAKTKVRRALAPARIAKTKKVVREMAQKAQPAAVLLGKTTAVAAAGAAAYKASRALTDYDARKRAEAAVRRVEKAMKKQYPNGLPADMRATLLAQHYEFEKKKPRFLSPQSRG